VKKKRSVAPIVGGIFGALALGALVFFVYKRQNEPKETNHSMLSERLDQPLLAENQGAMEMKIDLGSSGNFARDSSNAPGSISAAGSSAGAIKSAIGEHASNEIAYTQIATITNNCAEILGKGGFATVYRGIFYRQVSRLQVQ
jgi:hypothetical protein